ncbi:MAG: hypothetical protein ACOC3B_02900 [Bacillota bacterium]
MSQKKPETVSEKRANVAATSLAGIGCLVPLGFFLTVTGVGIIAGIPLILIGIFVFLSGTVGSFFIKGKTIICPYCYEETKVTKDANAYNCPRCEKRVLIDGEIGRKVDTDD